MGASPYLHFIDKAIFKTSVYPLRVVDGQRPI